VRPSGRLRQGMVEPTRSHTGQNEKVPRSGARYGAAVRLRGFHRCESRMATTARRRMVTSKSIYLPATLGIEADDVGVVVRVNKTQDSFYVDRLREVNVKTGSGSPLKVGLLSHPCNGGDS
jgi:hypothetical protein